MKGGYMSTKIRPILFVVIIYVTVITMAIVGNKYKKQEDNQDITMDLRMSERNNKLLQKINAALDRIENGTYGFSVVSGDEIGIKRMMARPLATLTIEEQEEYENHR